MLNNIIESMVNLNNYIRSNSNQKDRIAELASVDQTFAVACSNAIDIMLGIGRLASHIDSSEIPNSIAHKVCVGELEISSLKQAQEVIVDNMESFQERWDKMEGIDESFSDRVELEKVMINTICFKDN